MTVAGDVKPRLLIVAGPNGSGKRLKGHTGPSSKLDPPMSATIWNHPTLGPFAPALEEGAWEATVPGGGGFDALNWERDGSRTYNATIFTAEPEGDGPDDLPPPPTIAAAELLGRAFAEQTEVATAALAGLLAEARGEVSGGGMW